MLRGLGLAAIVLASSSVSFAVVIDSAKYTYSASGLGLAIDRRLREPRLPAGPDDALLPGDDPEVAQIAVAHSFHSLPSVKPSIR